ncbi:nicotinamide mononucleotide transporter [Parabacteroides sp. PFB2-12]|nr:nicotinamide mononucleotide transporter [Parabacteroides sp. PM6-13]MDH6390821.1 nicotinamide mononucleotide transporter [Parabacteroides sp. PFB2-12]
MMEQILEYFGVITGLLYLLLEIKQHRAMWVVGFLTSLTYVFVFFFAKVYADMGLNIYYVVISIYGFMQWSRQKNAVQAEEKKEESIVYKHITPWMFVGVLVAIGILFFLIWYVLAHYTDSPIPVGDAFTTAASIVATWMLAKCIIEHWGFWIVINLVSVYLYWLRDLYPTMFLYLCYALLPIIGWYTWKKKGIKAG